MFRRFLLSALLLITLTAAASAGDLYKVTLGSHADADILRATGVEPVLVLNDGYLIMTDSDTQEALFSSGLNTELIAADIALDQLALDHHFDRENTKQHNLVYEEGELRIYSGSAATMAQAALIGDLIPIDNSGINIEYRSGQSLYISPLMAVIDYDSLIALVLQDSIVTYSERLQAFDGRVTGTDSCAAARDWIAARFASFGYDSIFIDTFPIPTSGDGYNVIATKIGTRYPDRQIIIGGHFDAVLNSPGADDNGSGTTGVIEIARVLKDIETEMTIIFIAFDSEEIGLYGSGHYASEASARGDDIQYMLNMDMIAHLTNDSMANLFYGPEIAYSQLWGQLAQQYVGITGILAGASGSSDHA
ncbi:MAG: M28 family peptidase, partial [FCB group bacterium]|nr:M28 family peptidase [FCB group bacterium]